jgi:hypothetical protein
MSYYEHTSTKLGATVHCDAEATRDDYGMLELWSLAIDGMTFADGRTLHCEEQVIETLGAKTYDELCRDITNELLDYCKARGARR